MNSHEELLIEQHGLRLKGILGLPDNPIGLVIFAHGSGSSRLSSRNQYVASVLEKAGLPTLLMDLLEESENGDRRKVFDISLLASRLLIATDWAKQNKQLEKLPLSYFGASTGAGAALQAAAQSNFHISSVVSRGGRPDLAESFLEDVRTPTLLIVGGEDGVVIDLNLHALEKIHAKKAIKIIPGAGHLFEEPGTLDQAANYAAEWFTQHSHAQQSKNTSPLHPFSQV